ncbi:AAA domain-containing protein [Nocardia sp. IBHARD005]|uniref:AAA domain-containing protein n=1 Tax=Nocardia sp. IBHARD005 TaxID=3457765 RepID=UPI004058FE0E
MNTPDGNAIPAVSDDLAGRGARLFDFLAHAQQLRASRIKELSAYQRDGQVIWIADLPQDPAVTYRSAEPGTPFLVVEKVQVPSAPEPSQLVREWLDGAIDDPYREPQLASRRLDADGAELLLDDHPDVAEAYPLWLARWREWAPVAERKLAALTLYQTLYEVYTRYEGERETLEVVFGIGLLTWQHGTVGSVRRHVLTVPASVRFDSGYGALSVALDATATGYTPELQEFVDAGLMSAPGDLQRAEEEARTGNVGPFEREDFAALVRMFVNCINPDAEYRDVLEPGTSSKHPLAHYSPAIILRKRSNRGMVNALRAIAENIRSTGAVPTGMLNLVDPNHESVVSAPDTAGAIVRDGADQFLPLPLNPRQLQILNHVDNHAHTLVQGPPGTGKTHTAAALITHLLAQGKRVLITAHTDRALHEVRHRLPEDIKPLCVTVIGDSRTELEELKMSVNRINLAATEHDPARSHRTANAAAARIDELRRTRGQLHAELLGLRERDITEFRIGDYPGSSAAIASQWRADRAEFAWSVPLLAPASDEVCPVGAAELTEWLGLLRNQELVDPEVAAPDLVASAELPSDDEFTRWHTAERRADARRHSFEHYRGTQLAGQVTALAPSTRADLAAMVSSLDLAAREFGGRHEEWVRTAAEAMRAERPHSWQVAAQSIDALLPQVDAALAIIGFAEVEVTAPDLTPLLGLAETLRVHIEARGDLKLKADGTPKMGLTTARAVKDAQPLFDQVRVDGRIPTRVDQLTVFLESANCRRLVRQLDSSWPLPILPPGDGPMRDRVAAHRAARELLDRVLAYGDRLLAADARLCEHGFVAPNWAKSDEVTYFSEALAAADAESAWQHANAPLAELGERLATWCRDPRATGNLHDLAAAVANRDTAAYRLASERLLELHRLRHAFARRRVLSAKIAPLADLHDAVSADPNNPEWPARLERFDAAWQWSVAGSWLTGQSVGAVNDLCRKLDDVEDQLRRQASIMATTKAWDCAVGRLTNKARSDLQGYSQLVKDLGKGTGRFADSKRASIQRALADCRPSVPVWIMPIYRVVEQFEIKPDMFDVVVVDEASQAGAAAVFLQYLAPRIVVIGDDKQVSPSAVGAKKEELDSLAKQYLAGNRSADYWKMATRSLFDEAVMRFPHRLTLVEHRRCVPEIIGFSNKIAYEDQGVSLIPVRRYGSDRLPPVRTVHVPDGQEVRSKVNEVEADRVVAQIAACITDPAYDGKTFGVISLLGPEQAKVILRKLIAVVPPSELEQRHLHCGAAADFQGAERDVIFLSLVAAPREGGKLSAQVTDVTVERYNVAVSRARDQVWLFHSVTLDHLGNSEDLRFRLLDYFLSVEDSIDTGDIVSERFSDDTLVDPFESLFEQQVYNGLVDRGYRVQAHHTETACDLDIVVTGRGGQLAVQCDSDRWQGAEAYRAELDLQRDLERCDWPFHRIRQAEFIIDPVGCLDRLCDVLEAQGIRPIGDDPVPDEPAELAATTQVDAVEPEFDSSAEDVVADAVGEEWPAADPIPESMDPGIAVLDEFDWERPQLPPPAGPMRDAVGGDLGADQLDLDDEARWLKQPTPARSEAEAGEGAPGEMGGYSAFAAELESPARAPHHTIVEDLCGVVAAEGPVTGLRLRAAYVSAAKTRERDNVKGAIDRALHAAVAHGRLLVDDPLDLGDPGLMAYRTPQQPLSRRRVLGPRSIEQVPPRELAEVMAHHAETLGWRNRVDLFRAVIKDFGQTRLTGNTAAALDRVIGLAQSLR